MSNRLKEESSPYLQQHGENPIDWYPWCREAFDRADREGKPIFLSIGYSTCHWCHVMARESFEDRGIAEILNRSFVSIKVDREERPDIDSVYMAVCQAFTGRGGWPMSIFMTADQKPFFAGSYFPPGPRQGMPGFAQLLQRVEERWKNDRESLLSTAEQICSALNQSEREGDFAEFADGGKLGTELENAGENRLYSKWLNSGEENWEIPKLAESAAEAFAESFDADCGGFGDAPKFPAAHNLLFLMLYWKRQEAGKRKDFILEMVEKTLDALRRGGIFDQIGYGFSRYSTDRYFLAPHFEKMLYDNALLMLAYAVAYHITGKAVYLDTAEKTARYLLGEMTDGEGGFYSAQDADSDGEEGKFYLWDEQEICSVLGEERGRAFCKYYGVSSQGNFEGKNILNLLGGNVIADAFEEERQKLYLYRKNRESLHLDDKILTAWNALAICGITMLYRVSGKNSYLLAAKRAALFIENHLSEGRFLYVGCRNRKPFVRGFLEEYAYYGAALLSLYDVTAEKEYLQRALEICGEAAEQFQDGRGGYFLYGSQNSSLIAKPKEVYDGAMPSGNSVMAYCLVRLARLTEVRVWEERAERQLAWMSGQAEQYPSGHSFFLTSLLLWDSPKEKITVVLGEGDEAGEILSRLSLLAQVEVLEQETPEYRLLNGETTYYICKGHTCLPPENRKNHSHRKNYSYNYNYEFE